ncbi:MAG TPA: hypothetical protein VGM22_25220 [Methylomirabilota bacterium]|jgi:hypothetical protein
MTYRVTFKLEGAQHWRRYTVEADHAGEAAQLAHGRLCLEIPGRPAQRRWALMAVDQLVVCPDRFVAG